MPYITSNRGNEMNKCKPIFKSVLSAIALSIFVVGNSYAAKVYENEDTELQVNVTLGGTYQSEKDSEGEARTELSGNTSYNQVEFLGIKKVGEYEIFGEIEIDFDPFEDSSATKTDDTKIGVKGPFGRIRGGQFDNYFEDKIAEALDTGSKYSLSEPKSGMDEDHLQYTKKFGDLELNIDLTIQGDRESETIDDSAETGKTVSIAYKISDNLKLYAGIDDVDETNGDKGTAFSHDKTTGFALAYKTGELEFKFRHAEQEELDGNDIDYTGAGVFYDAGKSEYNFAFQEVDDSDSAVDSRTELAFNWAYSLFPNVKTDVDLIVRDKENDEGDGVAFSIRYKF